jgi:hypothetical protein
MWSRCCTRRLDPRPEPPPPHRTPFRASSVSLRTRVAVVAQATPTTTARAGSVALAGSAAYATPASAASSGTGAATTAPSITRSAHSIRELQRAADHSQCGPSHARLHAEPAGHCPVRLHNTAGAACGTPLAKHVPWARRTFTSGPEGSSPSSFASAAGSRCTPAHRSSSAPRGRDSGWGRTARPRPPRLGARLRISGPRPSPSRHRLAPTTWWWAGPSPSRSP